MLCRAPASRLWQHIDRYPQQYHLLLSFAQSLPAGAWSKIGVAAAAWARTSRINVPWQSGAIATQEKGQAFTGDKGIAYPLGATSHSGNGISARLQHLLVSSILTRVLHSVANFAQANACRIAIMMLRRQEPSRTVGPKLRV